MSRSSVLMVGTPAFGGQVSHLYALSILKLQKSCWDQKGPGLAVAGQWGDALVPRARQDLVTRFLEMPAATHLLFADADIAFEPGQVFRLLDFNVDIAAALYPSKRLDPEKAKALLEAGETRLEAASLPYALEASDLEGAKRRGGFAKVLRAGCGFMLVKRQVFLVLMKKHPELRYSSALFVNDPLSRSQYRYALFNSLVDEKTGVFLSEDESFCRRWTDTGGEIWVDLESRLKHVGSLVFEGDGFL